MYQTRSLVGSADALTVSDRMEVALTTSGGSGAVFFKINTLGETAFMDEGVRAVDSFPRG
jgi:Family of unknown function (DUF6054)